MNYLKIVQYFYLAFAAFFAYDAFAKYNNDESYFLSILIAAVSLGMFFFRRHFYNKYQNKK
ncbi:hypothetical protein [Flavobacterium celericrescens]|uniref:Uncharacterized protein n=1 Tax=Flavobacterium celericrescens TaxID=2709780 RepID=A0ABX0ICL4_9FLAO|nr:hypothetical protein [Flavobacterium celericrescens]NHM04834.1 hypothetical protein [Flavobacterium celericrescens]